MELKGDDGWHGNGGRVGGVADKGARALAGARAALGLGRRAVIGGRLLAGMSPGSAARGRAAAGVRSVQHTT